MSVEVKEYDESAPVQVFSSMNSSTDLDNNITRLYRFAFDESRSNSVPVRFCIENDDGELINIQLMVYKLQIEGINISDIYREVTALSNVLSVDDILMLSILNMYIAYSTVNDARRNLGLESENIDDYTTNLPDEVKFTSVEYINSLISRTEGDADTEEYVSTCNELANILGLDTDMIHSLSLKMSFYYMSSLIDAFYDEMELDIYDERNVQQREPYKSENIINSYNNWYTSFINEKDNDINRRDYIIRVQNAISEIEPLPNTPPVIQTRELVYRPKLKGIDGPVREHIDGESLFVKTQPSFEAPYVQYIRSDNTSVYRLYYGDHYDRHKIPFENVAIIGRDRPNTIYITVMIVKDTNKSVYTKEDYTTCEYHIDVDKLYIKIPTELTDGIVDEEEYSAAIIGVEDMIKKRIEDTLDSIVLGNSQETKIRGYFDVMGLTLDERSFHYLLYNAWPFISPDECSRDLIRTFLYIEESVNSRAEKNRLDIHYKSFTGERDEDIVGSNVVKLVSSVNVAINLNNDDTDIDISAISGENIVPPAKNGITRITIKRATSFKMLTEFINIFTRLLRHYMDYPYLNRQDPQSLEIQSTDVEYVQNVYTNYDNEYILGREYLNMVFSHIIGNTVKPTVKKNIKVNVTKKVHRYDHKIISNIYLHFPEYESKNCKDNYTNKYSRVCQRIVQPIIIMPDEVEIWREYKVRRHGCDANSVTVAAFPKQYNPKDFSTLIEFLKNSNSYSPYDSRVRAWFVCPTKVKSYPSLSYMKPVGYPDSGKDPLPFIQCAEKNDWDYPQRYFEKNSEDDGKKKKKLEESRKNVTNKGDSKSKIGTLQNEIHNFLDAIFEGKNMSFSRRIPVTGANNLLHCLYTAIACSNDKDLIDSKKDLRINEYSRALNSENEKIMKEITAELRTKFHKQSHNKNTNLPDPSEKYFNLCKQELYDYTYEEIAAELSSPDIHLDSSRHYRILEHVFGINIVVIGSSRDLHGDDSDDIVFEVPRSKLFHVRPFRQNGDGKNDLLLLFKHRGSESNRTKNAYYEIIFSEGTKTGSRNKDLADGSMYIFDNKIYEKVYRSFVRMHDVYNFTVSNDMEIRRNPFSKIDWEEFFIAMGFEIVSQHIDRYGKVYAFNVIYSNVVLTIFVPLTQPLHVYSARSTKFVQPEVVQTLFGPPKAVTRNGFWYKALDYISIFVPTKDHQLEVTDTKLIEPIIDEKDTQTYTIKQMRLAKQNASILVQLIRWCWRSDGGVSHSFKNWWSRWARADGTKENEETRPNLVSTLPEVKNTEEAIEYLSKSWPLFFKHSTRKRETYISLYPALYDKLEGYFLREQKKIEGLSSEHELMKPARFITGLYIWDKDYNDMVRSDLKDRVIMFNSKEMLSRWIASSNKHENINKTSIIKTIRIDSYVYTEPRIYENSGKLYIVQNVRGGRDINGNKLTALSLCQIWRTSNINMGFEHVPSGKAVHEPYILYTISDEGKLVPSEDHTYGEVNFSLLLKYRENCYGCILPLL